MRLARVCEECDRMAEAVWEMRDASAELGLWFLWDLMRHRHRAHRTGLDKASEVWYDESKT